jgi:hypothetical protein
VLLRDTTRGREWLSQFRQKDQTVARYMLDTLVLVSREEFESKMLAAIQNAGSDVDGPVACFAARKVPDDVKDDIRQKAYARTIRSASAKEFHASWEPPASYFDSEGNAPARPASGTGSEDVCASIIFQASRSSPGRVLDHPSIDTMRRKQVRRIVLVDDAIGSGQRMEEVIAWVTAHPSIRSWLSLGLIDVMVVVYAASSGVAGRLAASLPGRRRHQAPFDEPPDLRVLRELELRAGVWIPGTTPTMAARIAQLCDDYGENHRIGRAFRRGWRGSLGYLVFAHGCPNNVPGILRQRTVNWSPLFEHRSVPEDLSDAFGTNATDAAKLARATRMVPRLRLLKPAISVERQKRVLLLSALRKVRSLDRLVHVTGIPPDEVKRILRSFHASGFVAAGTNRITELGRRELAHTLRSPARTGEKVLTRGVYIPKSFRGGQRDN